MKPQGLFKKYALRHADGTPVDADGIYFVLKLNSKDDNHHAAAISAAIAYASVIGSSDPFLAADLTFQARSCCRHSAARKVHEDYENEYFHCPHCNDRWKRSFPIAGE